MEMAERLLQGKYEAVITTHLNTEHYHNHIVFNSVSMEDGKKYHSNSRSYYEDVRKASDALCLKYGLSVIEPKNSKGNPMPSGWQNRTESRPGELPSVWISGMRWQKASHGNSFWSR